MGLGRGVRQLRPSRERTAEAKTAETGGDSLHEEHIHASHGTRTRRRAERGVPVPAPPPPCHRMREAPGRGCAARCHRVHSGGRRSLPRSRVGLLVTLRVPPGAGKTEPTPSAALPPPHTAELSPQPRKQGALAHSHSPRCGCGDLPAPSKDGQPAGRVSWAAFPLLIIWQACLEDSGRGGGADTWGFPSGIPVGSGIFFQLFLNIAYACPAVVPSDP